MPLILPKSIFIHIPKTGGSWVREAVQRAGLPLYNVRHRRHTLDNIPTNPSCCKHSLLCDVSDADLIARTPFAFVRHPLSYFQSWWAFKMKVGWKNMHQFEILCESTTFSEFIEKMLVHFPGHAGRQYQKMDDAGITIFGRQERLAEDLIDILHYAGEDFDPNVIRMTPPKNVVGQLQEWQMQTRYTPELKCAVLEAEKETLKRYGYGTEIGEVVGSYCIPRAESALEVNV